MAICGALLASSAIGCSFGETLSRVCVLFIFPSSDSHARLLVLFPPRGPSGRFPRFIGTIGELRLLGVRPASLRFLRSAVSPSVRMFACPHRAPQAAPGLDQRVVLPAFLVKTTRPPRFPGAPMRVRRTL